MMAKKSPTSVAIALKQELQVGADISGIRGRHARRIPVSSPACAAGMTFTKARRAAIVDKDNRPQWRPGCRGAPRLAHIDAYFAPLGGDELYLPGEAA